MEISVGVLFFLIGVLRAISQYAPGLITQVLKYLSEIKLEWWMIAIVGVLGISIADELPAWVHWFFIIAVLSAVLGFILAHLALWLFGRAVVRLVSDK